MSEIAPPVLKTIEGVFVVELGEDYSHLHEQMMENLGLLDQLGQSAVPPLVALNVSSVQFIGSAFIGRLVSLSRRLADRDGAFALIGANKFCQTAIGLSGLQAMLPSYDDGLAAVEALKSGAASAPPESN